jgi:hypothetical protein
LNDLTQDELDSVMSWICENSKFYYKATKERDYIGYMPYTIMTYFLGECQPIGVFGGNSIRIKYLLGVGKSKIFGYRFHEHMFGAEFDIYSPPKMNQLFMERRS